MKICLANKKDAVQIAQIHCQEIKQGFLSQLGVKFLTKLYKAMIILPGAFIVIAKQDNQVIGFISGCVDTKKFYKSFIKKYFLGVFFIILTKIWNLRIFRGLIEISKYPKMKMNLPEAELFSIAVKHEFQGQGIGQQMFEKFVLEMKKRKINKFKVIVGNKLLPAIKFYEKMNFKFYSECMVHNNEISKIYTHDI